MHKYKWSNKTGVISHPLDQAHSLASSKHYFRLKLFHSANPQSRSVVIIVFTHVVSPSPLFKYSKTKQQKTMVVTGDTMGLAEWIIDGTCLLCFVLLDFEKWERTYVRTDRRTYAKTMISWSLPQCDMRRKITNIPFYFIITLLIT